MLRKISLITAVAAMLAIPVTQSSARPMGHGMRVGGGIHSGLGIRSGLGVRPGIGMRSGFGVRRFGVVHRPFFGRRAFFARRHFRPFFVASVFASSCYRWVWTPLGFRHVWVCDPYYGGYGYY